MDVFELIERLGVDLEYTNLLPPQRLGAYLDDERKILVRSNLTHTLEEEVLHHEYVHAKYRDRSCDRSLEHRAMREAALMIIDGEAYAAAERINPNPFSLARELDTTLHVVEAYQRAMTRRVVRVLEIA